MFTTVDSDITERPAKRSTRPWVRPGVEQLSSLPIVVALLALTGCGSKHRLADYDFAGETLAIAPHFPERPTVLTSGYSADYSGDLVGQVLKTGGQVARDVAAHGLTENLDSAASLVDVKTRLSERALERGARYLGARPVGSSDDAQYVLEVVVRDYGIDARQWDDAAHVFIDAEAILLDAWSGQEIWSARVDERDPISPSVHGEDSVTRDVVTAAALADMSVEELARTLERISDYCADRITNRLRSDLRD